MLCRYSGGLHQAIEAKEGVEVKPDSHATASITFQVFFRCAEQSHTLHTSQPALQNPMCSGGANMCCTHLHRNIVKFHCSVSLVVISGLSRARSCLCLRVWLHRFYQKLAGMTGTARSAAAEFYEIYGLRVVPIPTNKPPRRKDLPLRLYYTEQVGPTVPARVPSWSVLLLGLVATLAICMMPVKPLPLFVAAKAKALSATHHGIVLWWHQTGQPFLCCSKVKFCNRVFISSGAHPSR